MIGAAVASLSGDLAGEVAGGCDLAGEVAGGRREISAVGVEAWQELASACVPEEGCGRGEGGHV